jgi:acyl-CoA synthetase (AMP-forming)/AMP-acid ligase II
MPLVQISGKDFFETSVPATTFLFVILRPHGASPMLNLLLDKTSAKFPLKIALIFEDQTYTYADLSELAQAHVILRQSSAPVTARQLIDFAVMRLPVHKVPCRIIFAENLPHGPTGKIDRKTLRENAISRFDKFSHFGGPGSSA